jgi:hypothetical protein
MYEAVDHFSREQYRQVAARIRRAIGQTGVLGGSVGLSENAGQKGHWEHQNEFCQPEPLEQLLKEDFGSVTVEVTAFPLMGGGERRTAHFVARNPDG